jgi:hypothetical protein
LGKGVSAKVVIIWRKNVMHASSTLAVSYLTILNDDELERQGYLKLFDTNFSAGNVCAVLLIDIVNVHFESIKTSVER